MRSNIYTPSPDKWLLREVLKTHASLRFGIGIIAMFFPLLLWLIGCLFGLHMPPSISEYYWHPYTPHALPVATWLKMRLSAYSLSAGSGPSESS